jgi:hypothetical protein
MNPLLLHEKIKKVLHLQRMISVRNLALMLDAGIGEMVTILNDFEIKEYIRISRAKSCSSGCSSCSTCPTIPQLTITENDIIISLLFSRIEEYAD